MKHSVFNFFNVIGIISLVIAYAVVISINYNVISEPVGRYTSIVLFLVGVVFLILGEWAFVEDAIQRFKNEFHEWKELFKNRNNRK